MLQGISKDNAKLIVKIIKMPSLGSCFHNGHRMEQGRKYPAGIRMSSEGNQLSQKCCRKASVCLTLQFVNYR